MSDKIVTPEFRVSFPQLLEAKCAPGSSVAKFSVVALFPKTTDLSGLKKLAVEARDAKWPDPAKRPKKLRSPFRDGDVEKGDIEGYEGVTFVTLSSQIQPGVVDRNNVELIGADIKREIYPGCYARASVVAYAYEKAGNCGVAFGLRNIQKLRDGDPLGGAGGKPTDDFGPVEGDAPQPKASEDFDL